jgi:transposase
MVEGIVYRYRCGIAWRDVPVVFGPWQTMWTWHRRMAADGTWDRVMSGLLAAADAAGAIDALTGRLGLSVVAAYARTVGHGRQRDRRV